MTCLLDERLAWCWPLSNANDKKSQVFGSHGAQTGRLWAKLPHMPPLFGTLGGWYGGCLSQGAVVRACAKGATAVCFRCRFIGRGERAGEGDLRCPRCNYPLILDTP